MCCIVLKVIWYYSHDYGFVAKFADFPDEYDVAADTRDTLKSALLEYGYFHVEQARKEAGLPYEWQRIKLTFRRVSEEEFGPLFDEDWDDEEETTVMDIPLANHNQGVALCASRVEREGEKEHGGMLACKLYERGNYLAEVGKLAEALADHDQAVAIYTRLIEGGCKLLNPHLLLSLNARGTTLKDLGKFAEALATFDKAVGICTHLIEEEGQGYFVGDLAFTLNNRSTVLRELDELPKALADHDRAIAICLAGDRQGPEIGLARCLNNRGNSLTYLGKLPEALADHDQAVAIYTKLVECLHRRLDLAADLARSLNDRGTARRDDGQLRAAIADHEQAIAILTRLIEEEGQKNLDLDLALCLSNRGAACGDFGRFRESLADHERATSILTRLVEQEGRQGLASHLAMARQRRAEIRWEQSQVEQVPPDEKKARRLVH